MPVNSVINYILYIISYRLYTMRYYYLICRFVIMTLQLRLKFRVILIGGDIVRFRNSPWAMAGSRYHKGGENVSDI